MLGNRDRVQKLLAPAHIRLDGDEPWDPVIHDDSVFDDLISRGTIAFGESYVEGKWDVVDLPELVSRLLAAGIPRRFFKIGSLGVLSLFLRYAVLNLHTRAGARNAVQSHYDIGNDVYERMLDRSMTYSCGYWRDASSLDAAQFNKLDLVCRKLDLKPGDRVLDIGCGWGSFAIHAAKYYGASVVGVTISREQYELASARTANFDVEIRLQDYRDIRERPFDHIVSIGMFEHVGPKNYRSYMEKVRSLLKPDGLFLLQTIGGNRAGLVADPWTERYIFPQGFIPAPVHIARAIETVFVMEDWHNFGADYDATLRAWHENFVAAWPELHARYDEKFFRRWSFYLLSMAGAFRARTLNLWQIVLSPRGVHGGYYSVR